MGRFERLPVKPMELWGLYDVKTGKWIEAPTLRSDAIMAFRSYEEAVIGLEGEIFYELDAARRSQRPERPEEVAHAIAATITRGAKHIPGGTTGLDAEHLRIARLV